MAVLNVSGLPPWWPGAATGVIAIGGGADEDLSHEIRSLYVGTGGNVNLVMHDGTTTILKNVVIGTVLPVFAKRVSQTNTTASNLAGFY